MIGYCEQRGNQSIKILLIEQVALVATFLLLIFNR